MVSALVLVTLEARRWWSPPAGDRGLASAERLAAEVSRNMVALEEDLVAFLLTDGPSVESVAARAAEVEERFSWAHPLFVVDGEGEVLGPLDAVGTREGSIMDAESRRRRFGNLIRRARSKAAIERATIGVSSEDSERQATTRFAARNASAGLHVLINLERDRLWAAYRAKPPLLTRLLAPGTAATRGAETPVIRLIDPSGRVAFASRPETEAQPVIATSSIATAPQWTVEVRESRAQLRRLGLARESSSWIRLGGAALLLVVAWKLRSRDAGAPMPAADGGARSEVTSSASDVDEPLSVTDRMTIGDATVDFGQYLVWRGEDTHSLTDREVALLRLLVAAPNQVVRRDRILEEVWGYAPDVTTRTVDTFIYRLRQKIEADPQAPRHFLTVRGAGYRFVP